MHNSNLFLCHDQPITACYMHGQLWITANMYGNQGLPLTGYANGRQLWLVTCMSSCGLLHTWAAQGCCHIYIVRTKFDSNPEQEWIQAHKARTINL